MASVRKNAFWQVLHTLANLGFPLITFPYVSRLLGPDGMGQVSYMDAWVQFLVTMATVGIPLYGMREIARTQNDKSAQTKIFYQLLFINCLSIIIASIGFALFLSTANHPIASKGLMIWAFIALLTQPFQAEWFFHGNQQYQLVSTRGILIKLLTVILTFILIQRKEDFVQYYGLLVAMQVVVSIWNSYFYFKQVPYTTHAWKEWHQHLPTLGVFFLSTGAISFYNYIDTVILGWVSTSFEVGYYSTAMKIMRLCLYVVTAATSVLFPAISKLAQENNQKELNQFITKATQLLLIAGLGCAIAIFFLGPSLLQIMAGSAFTPAILLLQLLSFAPLLMGFSNLFGAQLMIPFKKEKQYALLVSVAAICSLPLHTYLSSTYASKGTAVATFLVELLFLGLTWWVSHTFITITLDRRFITAAGSLLGGWLFSLLGLTYIIKAPFLVLPIAAALVVIWAIICLKWHKQALWVELLANGEWIPGKKYIQRII